MAKGFPGGSDGEESACNVGDLGLIPGLERFPEEGNGNPLVFLPGEFHAQRSLESYIQSMGSQSGKGLSDYHKYTHTHTDGQGEEWMRESFPKCRARVVANKGQRKDSGPVRVGAHFYCSSINGLLLRT